MISITFQERFQGLEWNSGIFKECSGTFQKGFSVILEDFKELLERVFKESFMASRNVPMKPLLKPKKQWNSLKLHWSCSETFRNPAKSLWNFLKLLEAMKHEAPFQRDFRWACIGLIPPGSFSRVSRSFRTPLKPSWEHSTLPSAEAPRNPLVLSWNSLKSLLNFNGSWRHHPIRHQKTTS